MTSTWKATLDQAELALTKSDMIMSSLITRFGRCTITPHSNYYGELVSAIIGQQLSEKAGAVIYKRFLTLFDGKLPTPSQIIAIDTEAVRQIGCSYAKVAYMKDLATHILEDKLDLEHISNLPNETVIEQLTAVKGIGEWSAHMFMIFSLGRLNVLPTGDLGVRKAMMQLYDLPELPKPTKMHEIALLHGWAPYQSIAAWYLWQSLDNQPK